MSRKARPPIVSFGSAAAAAASLRVYRRSPSPVPLHAPGLHGHDFYLINYFDGGRGVLRGPRGEVRVAAGSVGLTPPGELHDASGFSRMSGWVAEFTGDLLDAPQGGHSLALPRAGMPWVRFAGRPWGTPLWTAIPRGERASWEERLARLADELRERRLGHREAARALLNLLLVDLARHLAPGAEPLRTSALVAETFAVIERRHAESISLQEVARAVGRSPSHLTATIRRETGLTVLEWITERRMAEARRRLQQTDEDIAIVAERVGYSDAGYFTRLFRRNHQLTPREFRAAHR